MNCWPSGNYVNLLYMYSILGRGSFCFNYCLNSVWHGGDQFVALLRWYGSPGSFDSLYVFFGLLFLIFLLTMGFRSGEFAGQSTHHGHLTNFWSYLTQWTNTSRWHCTPNHHRLWNLDTGFQVTWAMSFPTLPPDSRTLVSKWNTKLAHLKRGLWSTGNSPVLLLFSPGKTPLMTTVAKFLDTSVCGGSWWLDPSFSPFLVKLTQILE